MDASPECFPNLSLKQTQHICSHWIDLKLIQNLCNKTVESVLLLRLQGHTEKKSCCRSLHVLKQLLEYSLSIGKAIILEVNGLNYGLLREKGNKRCHYV